MYNEDVQAFAVEDDVQSCSIKIQDPAAPNVKNTYPQHLTLVDGSTLKSSAKLMLNAGSTALFAGDKNSRINISFSSADAALNGVAKVELDPKLAEQFEVFDYGNGNYAIGFKDGKVPAKITSANIALNVWLEGNETAKANASVKVKVSIVR